MQILKRALLLTSVLGCSVLVLPRLRGTEALLELIRVEGRVPVVMRDGVKLYADIYRPQREGRFPVLVVRTPYGVQRDGMHESKIRFAQSGYAVVIQDVRGRYESEGKWEPFRNEAEDGYDTIQWAAQQPWSNGKVATEGGSYLGHVQWRAASQAPPNLVTAFPAVASTSIYNNWAYFRWSVPALLQLWLGSGSHATTHHAASILARRGFRSRRVALHEHSLASAAGNWRSACLRTRPCSTIATG